MHCNILPFKEAHGYQSKDPLSRPSLGLGEAMRLSPHARHSGPELFRGQGMSPLPFCCRQWWAGARRTPRLYRWEHTVRSAALTWSSAPWPVCVRQPLAFRMIQLRYRKWKMESAAQHLSTVRHLRQQLSLWTICSPAIRMFLTELQKNLCNNFC